MNAKLYGYGGSGGGGAGLSGGGAMISREPSNLGVNITSWNGVYYPLLLLFSVAGTFVNGGFFCFHMLHIVNQNQLLSRVMQAVTLNGKRSCYE